jgi:nucleotide-binding universal stress UspA family protein
MKILIAYDGSISADAAIEDLRRTGLPKQTEAVIISVSDDESPHDASMEKVETGSSWRARLSDSQALATKACERIRSDFPQWTVSSDALWGPPAKIILDTSEWWHPDLIVVGTHGLSRVARLFLGSVSLELIHKAACTVRVARPRRSSEPGPIRIVIGNDGSRQAEAVIRSVAGRSWPKNTEARIVAAAQTIAPAATLLEASNTYAQEAAYLVIREADERMRFRLRNIVAESVNALSRAGLIATSAVIDGDPREIILAEAERCNADSIFVGARGLGRMDRLLLGSVSSHVVTHAHCSVEVVREVRHDMSPK